MDSKFDIVVGIDMETDVGSYTDRYEGVRNGTRPLLGVFDEFGAKGTFFWTAHAAKNNPEIVKLVMSRGHETGCHSLEHETLGDPLFPLPNNWPVQSWEVEKRVIAATEIVTRVAGVHPTSFRCPRLWGSTTVTNTLEKLGYKAEASLPLFFYRTMIRPYHPSKDDWTKEGDLKIVEIPNFCDLVMESSDPWNRDRDQWPLFRTEGSKFLLGKIDGFLDYVRARNVRPTLCFYFHPWEFYEMPQGALDFGEADVTPKPFITKNCGPVAVRELTDLFAGLVKRGGSFATAGEIADKYR